MPLTAAAEGEGEVMEIETKKRELEVIVTVKYRGSALPITTVVRAIAGTKGRLRWGGSFWTRPI